MFDNVGKNIDEGAGKRSAASVLIGVVLMGGFAAFTAVWGAIKVVEEITREPTDDTMVEVVLDEELDMEAPPPPPPPPPPAAAEDEEEEEEDETEDDTVEEDEMVEDQKELEKVEDKPIKSQERPKGVKDGVEGGVEGGVKDGIKDGIKDGVVGGELGAGGLQVFHHSELDVKKRTLPRYLRPPRR